MILCVDNPHLTVDDFDAQRDEKEQKSNDWDSIHPEETIFLVWGFPL